MIAEEVRQALLADVAAQMSSKRFEHVKRVEKKALELAQKYGVNPEDCQYAALLHDYAKEWDQDAYRKIVQEAGLKLDLLAYGSEILHGPVAAAYLPQRYPGLNPHIFQAIACHTIGSPDMSPVAKVLFIADYIEEGRNFQGVQEARALADQSLEAAIAYKLQHTIAYLAERGFVIYPDTINAYNAWIKKEVSIESKSTQNQ